jgi:hypothetical protein
MRKVNQAIGAYINLRMFLLYYVNEAFYLLVLTCYVEQVWLDMLLMISLFFRWIYEDPSHMGWQISTIELE